MLAFTHLVFPSEEDLLELRDFWSNVAVLIVPLVDFGGSVIFCIMVSSACKLLVVKGSGLGPACCAGLLHIPLLDRRLHPARISRSLPNSVDCLAGLQNSPWCRK